MRINAKIKFILFILPVLLCYGTAACSTVNADPLLWTCPSLQQPASVPKKAPLSTYAPAWRMRYLITSATLKESNPRYILLGDSLIHRWPQEELDTLFPKGDAINLGINGDTTRGLLWRIQNGHALHAENLTYIILIGTNNIAQYDPPRKIVTDIMMIIEILQKTNPTAKILLLGLLPRGPNAEDTKRIQANKVNDILQRCGHVSGIKYLNLEHALLERNGTLSPTISHDFLHLTKEGYKRILPHLSRALGSLLKE